MPPQRPACVQIQGERYGVVALKVIERDAEGFPRRLEMYLDGEKVSSDDCDFLVAYVQLEETTATWTTPKASA